MSRTPRPFAVLGFASTHEALDAESLLTDMGLDVVPIPAPKDLGALCGIALRLELSEEDRALGYLAAAGMAASARAEVCDV